MRVGVVGCGHVGLVTAAALAHLGHEVAATDSDLEKLALLSEGGVPFFEPGLPELVAEGAAAGRLTFVPETADVVRDREVVFICVGTPPREDGEANLVAVERVARAIARAATGPLVVVEKSTVPVGTAERVRRTLARERPEIAFEVASNPEFLREGRAVRDALEPDRILVGAETETARAALRALYEPLTCAGRRLIETDIATAELAKHACNAFLATKVSFVNALARICERAGADVRSVAEVMGTDPRIGPEFLEAGLGWGGYCFPKDLAAFARLAEDLGYPFPLLQEVARINDEAVEAAFERVRDALWNLEDKRVTLLGLAFKPGTDDVRFSPALALAERLLAAGATVVGYDPQATAAAKAELPAMQVCEDPYDAADGAHCAVVCTAWGEIRSLDLGRLREVMRYPILVDGRNALDAEAAIAAGFTYLPLGRPTLVSRQGT
ncbi:MAG: UDP-glucose 6-dehydrogenase [Actinomycetota bacterium]|nr:MAG: UDP-glucose 6-dehydrogenase [Actinomycetota bacterium]